MEKATFYGSGVIITNAKKTWVNYCSMKLMPQTFEIIDNELLLISSREDFEKKYPNR